MRYTIRDFNSQFKTDAECLRHIFDARYPNGLKCAKCDMADAWYQVVGRRSYACKCGHQVYPTAGTIFHKSPTALKTWFFAIFLMSASKNGVAAKELQRQLGVTYKCAWRMAHQIRKLMNEDIAPFAGVVEVDETFVGGLSKNMHKSKREAAITGTGGANKTPVQGILERGEDGSSKVIAKVVPNVRAETLQKNIRQHVQKGASVMTDKWVGYRGLCSDFTHGVIDHAKGYVRGKVHTNSIEGFWGQLKRSINGTHHYVSRKHLQKYADEFAFRYNRRKSEYPMFDHVLGQLAVQPF